MDLKESENGGEGGEEGGGIFDAGGEKVLITEDLSLQSGKI